MIRKGVKLRYSYLDKERSETEKATATSTDGFIMLLACRIEISVEAPSHGYSHAPLLEAG